MLRPRCSACRNLVLCKPISRTPLKSLVVCLLLRLAYRIPLVTAVMCSVCAVGAFLLIDLVFNQAVAGAGAG